MQVIHLFIKINQTPILFQFEDYLLFLFIWRAVVEAEFVSKR